MGKIWLFVLALCAALSTPVYARKSYSILQGSTSASETFITVVAAKNESLTFQARLEDSSSSPLPIDVKRTGYDGSDHVVYRLKISSLQIHTPYKLEVLNSAGEVLDQRNFKALDPNKRDGRVAVGSCMLRQMHNPFLWNNLAKPENRPDLMIILGDAVYLDRANLFWARNPDNGQKIWNEWIKARLKENFYYWENLVPTLSVWDDHDAGGDNVEYDYPLFHETRRIYDTFMANDPIPGSIDAGPGLSRTFKLFGKNFILLDARTFRDESPSNPLFGPDQQRFLLRSMKPGPNIILSGTQFFGGPIKKDSLEHNWPDFAAEWTAVMRDHAQWKGATLAFVSGDVHFSEVQDLEPELFGYWTVEITSSNIHSFGFPGHYKLKPKNPRRREVTGTHNIVLLEFTGQGNGFGFVTRAMGWRGNNLFKTVVSIGGLQAETKDKNCEKVLQAAE